MMVGLLLCMPASQEQALKQKLCRVSCNATHAKDTEASQTLEAPGQAGQTKEPPLTIALRNPGTQTETSKQIDAIQHIRTHQPMHVLTGRLEHLMDVSQSVIELTEHHHVAVHRHRVPQVLQPGGAHC
jgi:hypothetical protein